MVKTCVIIHGQIRGEIECWKNINKNIVIPNKADVFIQGYEYDENQLLNYLNNSTEMIQRYWSKKGIHITPPKEQFSDIFSPKATSYDKEGINCHITDKFNKIKDNPKLFNSNWASLEEKKQRYNSIKSLNYSLKRCIELKNNYEKQNNITYDIIILVRSDFNSLKPVYINNIPPNSILCKMWKHNKIAEQIFVGDKKTTELLINFYEKSDDLYLNTNQKQFIDMEEYWLAIYFLKHNIKFINYDFKSNYGKNKNGLLRFTGGFTLSGGFEEIKQIKN